MIYVLSDIHGNKKNWLDILDQINLKEDDELYVLGDVIDRYPHGIEILQQIMRTKNMHMILGNHEYMMLNALGYQYTDEDIKMPIKEQNENMNLWYMNNGLVTYEAFNKLTADEQTEIANFLKSLPLNANVEAGNQIYRLCHATIEELYDLVDFKEPESKASFCVWDRETIGYLIEMENIKIVFGHTPTFNFQPEKNPLEIYKEGSIIGIDCGSGWPEYAGDFQCKGRLACLRLDDGKEFYSK